MNHSSVAPVEQSQTQVVNLALLLSSPPTSSSVTSTSFSQPHHNPSSAVVGGLCQVAEAGGRLAETSPNLYLQHGPVPSSSPSVISYQHDQQFGPSHHQPPLPQSLTAAEFLQIQSPTHPSCLEENRANNLATSTTIPSFSSSSSTSNNNCNNTPNSVPSLSPSSSSITTPMTPSFQKSSNGHTGLVCSDSQQLARQHLLSASLMDDAIMAHPHSEEHSNGSAGGRDFFSQIIESLPESQYLGRNKLKVNENWYHVNDDGSFFKLSSRLDSYRHKQSDAIKNNIYFDHANILCGPPSAFMPPPPNSANSGREEEHRVLRMQRPFGKFKFNSLYKRIID